MAGWRDTLATALVAVGLYSLCLGTAGAAAQAPDPGGDESTPVTLPPAGGRYFGFTGGSLALESPGAVAPLVADGGGDMVRVRLEWRDVEPFRDSWNANAWARYRHIYDTMLARGVTPLFTLTAAPIWSRDLLYRLCTADGGVACVFPPANTPTMLDEWREFVSAVAQRFPRAAISIWNEPNLAGGWGARVDPVRYAKLVAAAYSAVKSTNPGQPVVGGALGTRAVTEPSADMDYRTFYRRALRRSPHLQNNVDAIDFHVYPGRPSAGLGTGTRFAGIFAAMRTITRAYGDPAVPFWVTEFGVTTSGRYEASEAQQSDLILHGVRRMLTMDDVGAVIVHALADNAGVPRWSSEYGFGVLHVGEVFPLAPKLAYCTLVAEAHLRYPLC